jgi:ubiquinone/menaquinone biosynthesis C-methylase UbiE
MKEDLLELILRKMRIRKIRPHILKDCVLCDVGCGYNAKFLHDISPYVRKGIGLDKKIENFKSVNLELIKSKIEKELPLPSNHVDCITLPAILEHLEYPKMILMECYRILKSEGVLIMASLTNLIKPFSEFRSFKLNIVSPVEISDHKNYLDRTQLIRILKDECGFRRTFQFGLNNFFIANKMD